MGTIALAILLILLTVVFVSTGPGRGAPRSRQIIRGHLALVWSDAPPGSSVQPKLEANVYTEDGRSVLLSARSGSSLHEKELLTLDRTFVEVTGEWRGGAGNSGILDVVEVHPAAAPPAAKGVVGDGFRGGLRGSQRFITIKVRYPDSPVIPLPEPEYFESLMIGSNGTSLDEYWREVSYGEIDLAGSEVVGWYTLPKPQSAYLLSDNQTVDNISIATDAVALAIKDVSFDDVDGINVILDVSVTEPARGGAIKINVEGVDRYLGATWLPPWAWRSHSAVAHEMGHTFGLPHSSGPYGFVYDSLWDVMSMSIQGCEPPEATFGCLGQHTIAAYKDWLGWIPDDRRYVAAPNSSQTIDIDVAERIPTGPSYLLAIVPVDLKVPNYLTVEVRARTGFDSKLPLEGVLIHRVIPTYDVGATVVDQTHNGDPNDDGAVLTAGERFRENGVSIVAVEATSTGYRVEITRDNGDDGPCATADVPPYHWRGEYFARDLVQAVPLVVRDDGDGFLHSAPGPAGSAPECGLPLGSIQIRWVRDLTLAKGIYRFGLTSNGATRLFVGGQPVFEDWIRFEPHSATRDIAIPTGDHRLIVQYRPVYDDPMLSLEWLDVTKFMISTDVDPVTIRLRKDAKIAIDIERRAGVTGAIRVEAPDTVSIGLLIKKPSLVSDGDRIRFKIKALKDALVGEHDLVFRGYDTDGTERTTTVRVIVMR